MFLLVGAAFALSCGEDHPAWIPESEPVQRTCPEWPSDWLDACRDTVDGVLRFEDCADDVYMFEVAVRGGPLMRIEVRASGQPGLRTVGPFGISPVGNFPDWDAEPETVRTAFDAFADCGEVVLETPGVREAIAAGAAGATPTPRGSPDGENDRRSAPRLEARPRVPWLMFGGFLLSAVVAAAGVRRESRADVAIAVALVAAALIIRPLVFPLAYFHQNGQGPLWIEYGMGMNSQYGPGFHEVFGLFLVRALDPDRVLIAVQTAIAALVSASVYVVSRSVGAPRALACALGALTIVEPGLGRVARSESYFAIWISLLAIATAVALASAAPLLGPPVAGPPRALRSRPALVAALGTVAAGLLVAQAARVHPVGWPAAALVPLAVVALPGAWTRRVGLAVAVGIGIGLVVAVTSLPTMLSVLGGALGDRWLPGVRSPERQASLVVLGVTAGGALVLGTAGAWASSRGEARVGWTRVGPWLDTAAVALVGATAWAVHAATNLLSGTPPHVTHAAELLFVWVPIAAVAAVGGRLVRTWRPLAAVLVVAVVATSTIVFAREWAPLTRLPTDAREALFVRDWRDELPDGATVFYLERLEQYVFRLPIYPNRGPATRHTVHASVPVDLLAATAGTGYWYRSSICSTSVGAELCDRVHASLALEPVFTASFPAIPSLEDLPYDRATVEVGLYRILGPTAASP